MTDINLTYPGERLLAVAGFVRSGAVLCDVGTDHAKLPIYLAKTNGISKAYATDINEGPIKSARRNVAELGLSESIECIRTDGLEGTCGLGITDVSICGMGGELILRILSDCSYVKDPRINLVLQPMTHTEDLRRYLYDSGFDVLDEVLVKEAGKLYVIINAVYDGVCRGYNETDLILGKVLKNKERGSLFFEMADRALYHLENKMKSNDADAQAHARKLHAALKEELK